MRPSAPFDPSQISIEKLTITEGQITVRHAASGRTHLLSEINTDVSAKSLDGPWRVDGTLRLDGKRTAISVTTGKVDATGGMRLRVQAEPEIYPVTIETDGDIRFDHGAAKYAGTFKLAARRRAGAAKSAGPGKGPGYRINGKFSLDHKRLSFDEFLFETGPLDNPYTPKARASSSLAADPRFALSLDGAQVRFDEAIGADEEPGGG